MHKTYDPKLVEEKWQKYWEDNKIFKVDQHHSKKKYYILEMLPYPSGRLHMGHVRNYSIGDVVARYRTMQGYNVLHPIGWDAFGMPAENAAIKHKTHPAEWTLSNIAHMRDQLKRLGFSYDWDREIATCKPEYYKWEQLVFIKMYEKGLIERKESFVNWCEQCQTVLANEQVVQGLCWRCDSVVKQKSMTQWYVKLPKYAEELLSDIDKLEGWPERVKTMQREWIGKSKGTMIRFLIDETRGMRDEQPARHVSKIRDTMDAQRTTHDAQRIEVFTTRPDTLYGATFMSIASEHPLAHHLSEGTEQESAVQEFIEEVAHMDRLKRLAGDYEKKGIFTGRYCINPVTKCKMPIYVANFVLMDYGTGAVMAVPTHDQRDFEFAKKYNLPLKVVIQPDGETLIPENMTEAYTEEGVLVNSDKFDGMNNLEAIEKITSYLEKKGIGGHTINYKLKDWCVSRQRYWGAPIPMIYCEKCGIVPVPEKDLPVKLPHDVKFTGAGGSPLAHVESFVNTTCPKCNAKAKRETDTLDTFVESSWYFLRYCSPKFNKGVVDASEAKYWMPIDHYIGGIEHAVGHLMYCRFYMKVLRDLGIIKYSESNEPAVNLLTQGMVIKDGAKMSKSKGNVVDPDEMIGKYGADTARMFLLFAAPPVKDLDWAEKGVEGNYRFLCRIWRLVEAWLETDKKGIPSEEVQKLMHKTIKKVTDDIERFHFNTAIAAIMEYVNGLYAVDINTISKENIENLVLLVSPFAPHMTEEIWQELGHKDIIYKATWPKWEKKFLTDKEVLVVVQVNGKLREKLLVPKEITEEDVKKQIMALEKVTKFIEGKPIKKIIYIPGKLVNIVI